MNDSKSKEHNLKFEEYKLFRNTAIHFDKILLDIRKSTITFSFIIFGFAAETFRVETIPIGKPIDLTIILILIELLLVLSFYYLEAHYRAYLIGIVRVASEYEEKLEIGIKINKRLSEKYQKSIQIESFKII